MDINDYTIPQAGKDWRALLSGWLSALPPSFTLWFVNRFGDLFLVFEDGSVHQLDVGLGRLKRLGDDRRTFNARLALRENANDWLMVPLVDACVAAGLTLSSSQCYGYKLAPILGGAYRVSNVQPVELAAHYSQLADLYRQTKHLPDGTPFRILTS